MNLDQFYKQLTPKSRLIVFLLSKSEMSFERLRAMTIGELLRLEGEGYIGDDLKMHVLQVTDGKHEDDKAFVTSSGRRYSVAKLNEILESAHKRTGVEYKGRAAFVELFA